MNISIEFHDSDVRAVEHLPDVVRISFDSAYLHHSAGRPGIDAGDGYVQPAEIVFGAAECHGSFSECVGTLSDGEVTINGASFSLLPVPFQARGTVAAKFVFCNGAVLTLSAESVACSVHGPSRWVEAYDA